jgi:hypothetical protein
VIGVIRASPSLAAGFASAKCSNTTIFSRAFQLFPVSQPGKPGEFDVESDDRVWGAERDNFAINVPNTPYLPSFTALDPADSGLLVEGTLLGDAE